ncbi:MAG: hypothetical protein LYZ66_01980 [Nitrososphaerales archaeon]|nr:hypothetical protein [Nitrososphaerales archaeon]
MPIVTVSLSDDVVRRTRKIVREVHGSKKGALSGLVESALKDALAKLEQPDISLHFRAVKGGVTVAEAESLAGLASMLKDKGVEPRSVRIISRPGVAVVARAGLRTRSV